MVWLTAWPRLLLGLVSTLCFLTFAFLVVALSAAPTKGPQKCLKCKCFATILMLLLEKLVPLHQESWNFLMSSTVQTHTEAVPLSSHAAFHPAASVLPLLLSEVDENGNPTHNNMVDAASSLTDHFQETLVIAHNGAISHVKNSCGGGSVSTMQVEPQNADAQAADSEFVRFAFLDDPGNGSRSPSLQVLLGNDASPPSFHIGSLTPCQNEVEGDCCWHALQPFLSCPAADIKACVSAWIAKHPGHPSYPPTTVSASSFVSQWGLDAAVQAFHEHLPSGLVVFHCPTNLLVHYQACCAPHVMCLDATLPLSFATSPSLLYTERNPDGVGHFERLAYVPGTPFLCLSPPPCLCSASPLPHIFAGAGEGSRSSSQPHDTTQLDESSSQSTSPVHAAQPDPELRSLSCSPERKEGAAISPTLTWSEPTTPHTMALPVSAPASPAVSDRFEDFLAGNSQVMPAQTLPNLPVDVLASATASHSFEDFGPPAASPLSFSVTPETLPAALALSDTFDDFGFLAYYVQSLPPPPAASDISDVPMGVALSPAVSDTFQDFGFLGNNVEPAAPASSAASDISDVPMGVALSPAVSDTFEDFGFLGNNVQSLPAQSLISATSDTLALPVDVPVNAPLSPAVSDTFEDFGFLGNNVQSLPAQSLISATSDTLALPVDVPVNAPLSPAVSDTFEDFGFLGNNVQSLQAPTASFSAIPEMSHVRALMDSTAPQTVLSLAAPAPIIPSLGVENASNELDELDYAILAAFPTLPHMYGGMLTPSRDSSDEGVLAQLLQLEVPAHIARQASALFPTDLNAALDWACSSERRHNRPWPLRRNDASGPVIDLDPDVPVHVLPPPVSWGAWAPETEDTVVDRNRESTLVVPIPEPLLTMTQRAQKYWSQVQADATAAAQILYHAEVAAATSPILGRPSVLTRLLDGFLTLPSSPPQHCSVFGLQPLDLFAEELKLFKTRTAELHGSSLSVATACAAPLDVIGLCPFPLAVACILGSTADLAPEFIAGFVYSLAGWVCHKDFHAIFDPVKTDRRTRPRCVVQCICDSAAGKSPFWRGFVSPWFTGVDGVRSVFESHPHLWASGGPKGLHIAQATDPDLANRMLETKGHLFWASPECWLMLDTAHAKKHAEPSKDKINFHYLLECQNGNDYGPRSIKSSPVQVHVPTTNFGMLLLGQGDCIHDFWGQVFSPGSPVRSKGFEGRPLFLWAGAARLCHQEQQISAEIIFSFLKAILLNIAHNVGHNAIPKFIDTPAVPDVSHWWRDLKQAALNAEDDGPPCAQVAAAKWGYTCGTHILENHLFVSSFFIFAKNRAGVAQLAAGFP